MPVGGFSLMLQSNSAWNTPFFLGKMCVGTEMYCHSFDHCMSCIFVLWQHFLGFEFFPFTIRKAEGCQIAEGSILSLPAEQLWLDAAFLCQTSSEKAFIKTLLKRYRSATQGFFLFTLREVLGSVFKLSLTPIYVLLRWYLFHQDDRTWWSTEG